MAANYAALQAADFEAAVAGQLPPPGIAWPRQPGGVFQGVWRAVAGVLAAFHAREAVLTEQEAFPPTAVELLPRWESVLGLPDPCLGANPATAARQAAVRARLAASGGQSVPYFQALATNLGGTVTITQYAPWRWGVDSWWSAWRSPAWAYVWLVTQTNQAGFDFEWGASACWEPWWQIANGPIECEFRRLAPAHTLPLFSLTFAPASGLLDNGGFVAFGDPTGYPTSDAGLAPGALWNNNGLVCVKPGATPNPAAPPVYFSGVTAASLLALGGANLPVSAPPAGSQQLWNNGGFVCIA